MAIDRRTARLAGALAAALAASAAGPPGASAVELTAFSLSPRCLLPPAQGAAPLHMRLTVSEPARLMIRLQRRLDSPARLLCPRGAPRRPFVPGRFGRARTLVRTVPAGRRSLVLPIRRGGVAAHTAFHPGLPIVSLEPGTYRVTLLARAESGTSQVLLRNFIVLRPHR